MQIQSVVRNCTYLTKSADNFFLVSLFVSHEDNRHFKFGHAQIETADNFANSIVTGLQDPTTRKEVITV